MSLKAVPDLSLVVVVADLSFEAVAALSLEAGADLSLEVVGDLPLQLLAGTAEAEELCPSFGSSLILISGCELCGSCLILGSSCGSSLILIPFFAERRIKT